MAKRTTSGSTSESVSGDSNIPTYELLPGERFGPADRETQSRMSDEELNSRYAKGDIRIVTESARYSLAGILAMLQEDVAVEGEQKGV